MPGTSVRTAGVELGERRVGHLEIRGPSVVGHYHAEPPPAADAWLRTGDLRYLADGELVVCGREKDMLIVAGRNVFLFVSESGRFKQGYPGSEVAPAAQPTRWAAVTSISLSLQVLHNVESEGYGGEKD